MRFKEFIKMDEGMWFGDSGQNDPGAVHHDPGTQRPPREYPGKDRKGGGGGGMGPMAGGSPALGAQMMKKKMKKK